jgi:RHS repeat-associated protein
MQKGGNVVRYRYGLDSKILSKDETVQGETTSTLYIGDSYEIETSSNGVKKRHHVGDFLTVEFDDSSSQDKYLYKDFLGSTLAVADQSGRILEKFDYDPFGQRRGVADLKWLDGFRPVTTSRGFTGHDHADSMDLIHMKGRVYDPTMGLFLSPDPFIQNPTQTSNLNRYSYVLNNPLSYTDPSGYMFEGIGRSLVNGVNSLGRFIANPYKGLQDATQRGVTWISNANNQRLVAAVAISVVGTVLMGPSFLAITGWAQMAAYSAAVGYTSAYVASNGDQKAALNGAMIGAVFSLVGSAFQAAEAGRLSSGISAGKIAAHAVVGGTMSMANGGKFESGFLSSGLSQAIGQGLDKAGYGVNDNPQGWDYASNAAVAAVVGGTVSEISGGSFEQGALTAAMGRLFNDLAHIKLSASDEVAQVYDDGISSNNDLGQCLPYGEQKYLGVANVSGAGLQNDIISDIAFDGALGLGFSAARAGVGITSNLLRSSSANEMVVVMRWGREGLQTGDWVMKGSNRMYNYVFSGKWQPGMGNELAKFSSGQTFVVPRSSLRFPMAEGGKLNPANYIKYSLGQRQYYP